jgi:hypothetical protein
MLSFLDYVLQGKLASANTAPRLRGSSSHYYGLRASAHDGREFDSAPAPNHLDGARAISSAGPSDE